MYVLSDENSGNFNFNWKGLADTPHTRKDVASIVKKRSEVTKSKDLLRGQSACDEDELELDFQNLRVDDKLKTDIKQKATPRQHPRSHHV